jgi:hypothetical protein
MPPRLHFVYEFPLRELTPSAERRGLSLAFEPAAAHAPTDLAEKWFLVPLSGSA